MVGDTSSKDTDACVLDEESSELKDNSAWRDQDSIELDMGFTLDSPEELLPREGLIDLAMYADCM